MPEPITIVSTVTSTVSSSLTIAKFIKDIKNTPTDVKTCFDLTQRVKDDVQTLISLRARHEKYLLTVPDTLKHLDRIICDTNDSILDVCSLLEGCRKEVYEDNMIPFGRKVKWVLGDSAAFARRTANLQQQHATLNREILGLRQIDILKPLERLATTTFENVELLSMERKKTQSRLDKGELTALEISVINNFEDCQGTQGKEADPYFLDVGQAPPFGLAISPIASPMPTALSLQQPVQMDYRTISDNSRPDIEIEEGESTDVDKNGDDDAEGAFYRDLRRQEEERQQRLATRKRIG